MMMMVVIISADYMTIFFVPESVDIEPGLLELFENVTLTSGS